MSVEVTVSKRVTEITVNNRTIEMTKGWTSDVTLVQLPSYLSTNLPGAGVDGRVIFISDEGVLAYSSGGQWIS